MKKLNVYRVTEESNGNYVQCYYVAESIAAVLSMRNNTSEINNIDKLNVGDELVVVE